MQWIWNKKTAKRLFILANVLAWMFICTMLTSQNTSAIMEEVRELREARISGESPRILENSVALLEPYLDLPNGVAWSEVRSWQFVGSLHIMLPFLLMIYGNWLVLIPQLLGKRKYGKYILSQFALMIGSGLILSQHYLYGSTSFFSTPTEFFLDGEYFFESLAVGASTLAVSMPLYFSFNWFQQQEKLHQLENDQLEAELALLKSQINPHFFFNTLNNLYALALDKSNSTPTVILRLSDLMRYTIYEGRSAYVPVELEAKCLEDYLELQSIRLNRQADIRFELSLDHPKLPIVPLLFLNFVENAFKHGVDTLSVAPFVHIRLYTTDQDIHFEMENNYDAIERRSGSGTGIENSRRRLEILYPGTHTLQIVDQGNIFKVVLRISTV